jgi:hypothetical protein
LALIVANENAVKQVNVPRMPNMDIFLKFEKKLPLYILNPEAKTIGGKQTKKNVSSLNFKS